MIRKSFIWLERIARKGEKNIWKQEIHNWDDFLKCEKIKGISTKSKEYYNRKLVEGRKALAEGDGKYFLGRLPQVQMWRLYDEFRNECCFLDIEVDAKGRIIVVGISNYYNTNFFVRRINLNLVKKELDKYKMIITFNGGAFDIPKLYEELGVKIEYPHIDLKPLCVNLELKGGLKEVERILELKRPTHLYGNPVDLWKAFHASGDREYLDLLLEYNREDVENLKLIMEYVYKKLAHKQEICILS